MDIIKGIRTRRGAKLNIKGTAEKILSKAISTPTYALKPNFLAISFALSAPELLEVVF